MKISVSVCELHALLKTVTRCIESRSIAAWMDGVKLAVEGERLTAACANGMETICRTIPCADVGADGTAVLDGKLLLNVVSKLDDGTCQIDTENGKHAKIKARGSNVKIALMDEKDFAMPTYCDGTSFEWEAATGEALAAFKTVLYAAPSVDARDSLVGVNVRHKGNDVRLCAMDGYRMAISEVRGKAVAEKEAGGFTIPRKAVVDMLDVFKGSSSVRFLSDGKSVVVKDGETTLHSQLTAGAFVDYERIISSVKPTCEARVSTQKMKDAVARVMVMCDERSKLMRMHVGQEAIKLSSMRDVGDATDEVQCAANGEDVEIGFNGRLLLDALNAIDDSDVTLRFSGSLAPMLMAPAGDGGWTHCVMPVRMGMENGNA